MVQFFPQDTSAHSKGETVDAPLAKSFCKKVLPTSSTYLWLLSASLMISSALTLAEKVAIFLSPRNKWTKSSSSFTENPGGSWISSSVSSHIAGPPLRMWDPLLTTFQLSYYNLLKWICQARMVKL